MGNRFHSKELYVKEKSKNIFIRIFIRLIDILNRFSIHPRLRLFFHKLMGTDIGENVFIGMECHLDYSFPELISIEDDVVIAFRVTIVCHDDARIIESDDKKVKGVVGKVLLKKGCYIGTGAIILPGVTIGEGAIIGAGSVVAKDVDSFSVVIGNPCRMIRSNDT